MRGLRSIAIAIVVGATGLAGSSSPEGLGPHHAASEVTARPPRLVDRDANGHRWAYQGPLGHRWIALGGMGGERLD